MIVTSASVGKAAYAAVPYILVFSGHKSSIWLQRRFLCMWRRRKTNLETFLGFQSPQKLGFIGTGQARKGSCPTAWNVAWLNKILLIFEQHLTWAKFCTNFHILRNWALFQFDGTLVCMYPGVFAFLCLCIARNDQKVNFFTQGVPVTCVWASAIAFWKCVFWGTLYVHVTCR